MTMQSVERWDIFELTLTGPTEGNPFMDVTFGAKFAYKHRVVDVDGFYDGDGTLQRPLYARHRRRMDVHDAQQRRRAGWRDGRVHLHARVGGESRAGARARYLPLRLRGWHAALLRRHDVLRVESPGRRAGGTDAGDAQNRAFQQDADVRLPQALHLQPK